LKIVGCHCRLPIAACIGDWQVRGRVIDGAAQSATDNAIGNHAIGNHSIVNEIVNHSISISISIVNRSIVNPLIANCHSAIDNQTWVS
jgi:hypothetical protein